MIKKIIIFVLIAATCFCGCNKSEDNEITDEIKTDEQITDSTEATSEDTEKETEKREPTNLPNSHFDYNKEHLFFATDSKSIFSTNSNTSVIFSSSAL